MVVPNRERIDRALLEVRDGIRPGCIAVWSDKYGQDWMNDVHSRDKKAQGFPDLEDPLFFLKGIHNTWMECWKQQLADNVRNYVGELRNIRNEWAHGKALSSDETYRALDTAELVLQAFSAGEQVQRIQQMKRDHSRQVFDEQARGEKRKAASKATEGEPLRGLSPWRDVITPHDDVASGRFEQAEFAADLHQVAAGQADPEYQDPAKFYNRTFLTAGLSDLLLRAASRLAGKGGDPVIDLQTNFGGGKTHSMIALYHLASGAPLEAFGATGEVLRREGITLPSSIARAVLVGQMISPSQPKHREEGVDTHTLWGDLAYQLAGKAGYELVRKDDENGTNPGDRLLDVFDLAGPCIILIDEWVAYARQLPDKADSARIAGGDFDTQFTFAQSLTENAGKRPNVVVLISIPASDIEVGGERGQIALEKLKNLVKRVSKQWSAATDDESFEIVRTRLFEPMSAHALKKRDAVIHAYWDYYRDKSADFPSEVAEASYKDRMKASYPVHPELFDRLYKDWSTLDRFQRTRGVLRLMASVVSALWQKADQNLLIMPGNFPLDDAHVSAELLRYLEDGWEPVVRSDVDGPNSLPLKIDAEVKNLGRYSATRRVARATFLAAAPRDEANRGVEAKRIVLGTAQPGESPGAFDDALKRLSGQATYVYADNSRYWYSLRANINRLAHERAQSNFSNDNADDEVKRRLQSDRATGPFAVVHVFPDGPGDVTDDDDGVHLVILPPTAAHLPNTSDSKAFELADKVLNQRNAGPRVNRNMLVFLAATEPRLAELRQSVKSYLAWKSIQNDKETLQLTPNDINLASTKIKEAETTLTNQIFETFQHILVPSQTPGTKDVNWETPKTSGTGTLIERVAKKLESEEKIITKYGGVRVRMDLDRIPLWTDRRDVSVGDLWKRYAQFPYLPRLASPRVLDDAIGTGVSSTTWQTDTFAYAEAHDGTKWVGLHTNEYVPCAPSGLVVHPEAARAQISAPAPEDSTTTDDEDGSGPDKGDNNDTAKKRKPASTGPRSYVASFPLPPVRAIKQLDSILQNVVDQLAKAPNASITIQLEVNAESAGFTEAIERAVKENANQLNATTNAFDD